MKNKSIHFFVALVFISLIISVLANAIVFSDNVLIDHFSAQLSLDRIQQFLDFRDQWQWVNYAVMPVVYLLKFSLLSLWILCGTVFFGYKVRFKDIFGVVIIAEFIWFLPSIISLIWFGLFNTNYTLTDILNFQPLSLMSLFDPDDMEPWLVFPMKAFNLFEVGYVLFLAFLIRKVIKGDWMDSVRFTVPVYAIGFLTWITFITFLTLNLTE